jgi:hypothetical protein
MLDQDLLPAELELVAQGVVDLGPGDPVADWPDERLIRAETLRRVLLEDTPTRVHVIGARIDDVLDLDGMCVKRSVVLERCYFAQAPNLQDAELVSLRMHGSRLAGGLELSVGFHSEARVQLTGASIGGILWASGRFEGEGECFDADAVSVGNSVFLGSGFVATAEVRMLNSRIEGSFDCAGSSFENHGGDALSIDGIRVAGSVFLNQGFRTDGQVRMVDAEIRGELNCMSARLVNPGGVAFRGDRMVVQGAVIFQEGFSAQGQIRMIGARIGSVAFSRGATLTFPDELALDLEGTAIDSDLVLHLDQPLDGWVDLTHTTVATLSDTPAAWQGGYELRGFRYGRLRSIWEAENRRRLLRRDTAVAHRLAWLAGNRSGYVPQLYDQLIQAYGAAGEEAHQRDVLMAKQRRRRSQLPWYAWLWSLAIDLLIGFGYRTGRALIPFVAFLGFGTWFFADAYEDGDIVARSTAATMNVPPFRPFIYSLDQLVPVVNFGQRENWVATGDAQTLVTIMVIAGWVLTTAILAALTGLVRRNQ